MQYLVERLASQSYGLCNESGPRCGDLRRNVVLMLLFRYDKDHKISYPAGSREAIEVCQSLPWSVQSCPTDLLTSW